MSGSLWYAQVVSVRAALKRTVVHRPTGGCAAAPVSSNVREPMLTRGGSKVMRTLLPSRSVLLNLALFACTSGALNASKVPFAITVAGMPQKRKPT